MTGLVDLYYPDGIIALDSIRTIGEPREVQQRWGSVSKRDVICADGSKHSLGTLFVDGLLRRPTQLMPAEPGTFAVHAWIDGDERGVSKTTIIAWALCVDGEVRPVTPQGVNDGDMMKDGEGYVLMPDKTVQSVGEHVEPVWFDTLGEYCQHMWDKQAAQEVARKAARVDGAAQ